MFPATGALRWISVVVATAFALAVKIHLVREHYPQFSRIAARSMNVRFGEAAMRQSPSRPRSAMGRELGCAPLAVRAESRLSLHLRSFGCQRHEADFGSTGESLSLIGASWISPCVIREKRCQKDQFDVKRMKAGRAIPVIRRSMQLLQAIGAFAD